MLLDIRNGREWLLVAKYAVVAAGKDASETGKVVEDVFILLPMFLLTRTCHCFAVQHLKHFLEIGQ